jgi:DNA helicase-2/ATP-dependent DNA helicase PcrA
VATRVERGEALADAVRAEAGRAKGKGKSRVYELADLVDKLKRHSWPHSVHLIQDALVRGLPQRESQRPDEERKGVPKTCAAIAKRFATPLDFYTYAASAADNAKRAQGELPQGKVVLSTVHAFKGLERPVVFVPIDEGLFPHARSLGDKEAMDEEYRLAYVAFTRARDVLAFVTSRVGLDGLTPLGPSEFVNLLPEATQADIREALHTVEAP